MPEHMYVVSVAVKGTEDTAAPQLVLYAPNPVLLKILVNHHNEYIKMKKQAGSK